jgi:hypothetical protein
MIRKLDKSVVLLLQTTLENQRRLKFLEARVKRLERRIKLAIEILLWLLVIFGQMAK